MSSEKKILLRKIGAVSLAAAMLVGTGAAAEIGTWIGTNISVSAATTKETSSDSFEYKVNDNGNITITKFKGSETKVVIPSKIDGKPVTCIDSWSFSGFTSLTSVTIPDSVTKIGDWVFEYCTSLKTITIPDSVTQISYMAFRECPNLTSINVSANNQKYLSEDGVLFDKDKTNILMYPAGKKGSYTIPDTVTHVSGYSFIDCTGLTGVTIPDSVIYIFAGAFSGCTSLKSVTIPDSVKHIYDSVFFGCTSLTSIKVSKNNESYLSKDGVLFNKAMTTLVAYPAGKKGSYNIPNSVTEIEESAFGNCTSLTSVTIPNGVTKLNYGVFYGCTSLTNVTIPDSVTEIDWRVFSGCTSLTSVIIPESVTEIGHGAIGYYFHESGYDAHISGVTIYGKKGTEAERYANDNEVKFVDIEKFIWNNTTVSQTNFQVGEAVTVKGAAAGGNGDYRYEFYYKRTTSDKWVRFGSATTATFKPSSAGSFNIRVYAKDSAGNAAVKNFTVTATAPLVNNTTVSKTNFTVGQTVTVKGAASGGSGTYTYEFYYKKSTASTWTKFGSATSANFKPSSAGTFSIRVYAKDSAGTSVVKNFTLTAFAPLVNNTTVSKTNFTVGQTITVKGAAAGGNGTYKYEFYYKRTTSDKWVRFGSATTATFKPASAGSFNIRVYAKDSVGNAAVKNFTVTAAKAG